jgi:hypothetical protein
MFRPYTLEDLLIKVAGRMNGIVAGFSEDLDVGSRGVRAAERRSKAADGSVEGNFSL